ncbi:MAG TPA: winged helix DNA-binding protein [Clostridiales bacterium]|nr:winged helix DNA-binding protein [Clostridiales bacterium]
MNHYYHAIHTMMNRLVDRLLLYECRGFKENRKGKNLSLLDVQILYRITNGEEKKLHEIVRETGLERNLIASSVRRLLSCGYIQKEQSEKDRRVHILKATDSGKEFIALKQKEQKEWLERILEDMSLNETKAVLKFLTNIEKK